jgi:hypothetical protein
MGIQHENHRSDLENENDKRRRDFKLTTNLIATFGATFCSEPTMYEWKYVEKREMLVPYNCAAAGVIQPNQVRWEKHKVWIVDGIVRPGESNILARRRFYVDEDSSMILMGEGYDTQEKMLVFYMLIDGMIPGTGNRGSWYAA